MKRPRYDGSVSLGDVISVIALLAGMWAGFASIRERIAVVETQLAPLWHEYQERAGVRAATR